MRYRASIWLAATGASGDGVYVVARYAVRLIRLVVLLAIWKQALNPGSGSLSERIGGDDPSAVLSKILTYTVVSSAFALQLDARTDLGEAVWDGRIAVWSLAPVRVFGLAIANTFGRWIPVLLGYSLPILLCAPLLGVETFPASGAGWPFLLSLMLAVAVGFAIDLLLVSLMVRTGWSLWDMQRMRMAFGTLLSGAIVPLRYFPWDVGQYLVWSPLAAMASAPLEIFVGSDEVGPLLLRQASWVIALWIVALRFWARQRERLLSYGG